MGSGTCGAAAYRSSRADRCVKSVSLNSLQAEGFSPREAWASLVQIKQNESHLSDLLNPSKSPSVLSTSKLSAAPALSASQEAQGCTQPYIGLLSVVSHPP